jgi:ABC-type phosphate transport system permease subunit
MKAQMKFQKILTLVSLIIAALTFVYALIFLSGNLSNLMYYIGKNWDGRYTYEGADGFLLPAQNFVSALVTLSIIYICVVVTLYITASNKRRNYYITNYVSVGLNILFGVVVGLFGVIYLSVLVADFYAIDWEKLNKFVETLKKAGNAYKEVSQSPGMFIVGYIVFVLVLANAAAWTYNLIWKIKLMKGEKALLANGLNKEVA